MSKLGYIINVCYNLVILNYDSVVVWLVDDPSLIIEIFNEKSPKKIPQYDGLFNDTYELLKKWDFEIELSNEEKEIRLNKLIEKIIDEKKRKNPLLSNDELKKQRKSLKLNALRLIK